MLLFRQIRPGQCRSFHLHSTKSMSSMHRTSSSMNVYDGIAKMRLHHGSKRMLTTYRYRNPNGCRDSIAFNPSPFSIRVRVRVRARARAECARHNMTQMRFASSSSWLDTMIYRLNPFQQPLVTGKLSDLDKDYEVVEKLGYGRFGEVFSARQKHEPFEVHAIKTIPKSRVINIYELRNEIEMLEKVDHPHIISVKGIYEEVHTVHIVTELCTGGELFDRIIKKGRVSEQDACRFIRQILDALAYCHSKNIVHRDIKPENVLFKSPQKRSPLCLVDFGLARIFKEQQMMSASVGSPTYMAPEVLNLSYSEKCDLWSTGVILFMLLSGETPFPGKTEADILAKVKAGDFKFEDKTWKDISDEAMDLVTLLLQVDPEKRISAAEALQHRWILNEGSNPTKPLESAFQNIQSFNSHRKLKRAALGFIAEHLVQRKDEDIAHLEALFERLDTDNDGLLSIEEVAGAIQLDCGEEEYSGSKLEEIVREVDADKSGMIDIDEFIQASMKQALYLKESCISAAFEKFDVDGKGSISKDDLVAVFGEDSVAEIMREADLNQDGVIDYKEFAIAVRNKEQEDMLRPQSVGKLANKLRRAGKI